MDEIDYTSHLLVSGNSGRWDHPWTMNEEDAQAEYDELQARPSQEEASRVCCLAEGRGREPVKATGSILRARRLEER